MNWNAEKVQTEMIRQLLEKLPAVLEAKAQEPVSYIVPDGSGQMIIANEAIPLPMFQEIWTQQQPALNFPALILHYQDDNATDFSDCGELEHKAIWFADVIVTHPDAEALSMIWFRYVEALRECLSSMAPGFGVLITGPRITENGPLESLFLRRGFLTVQVTYT